MKFSIRLYSFALLCATLLPGCLDMDPESSINDENMWKTSGQFKSFVYGVHSRLRDADIWNMFMLGELRSDIYSSENAGWTGESNKAYEMTSNTLSAERPGIENYGGLYTNINQINLFIRKASQTKVLSDDDKSYYMGEMYGLRAFYYFHLLRSWGNVVWNSEPSIGFDIAHLDRKADEAAAVMEKIKQDIQSSEDSFGNDYSFRTENRSLWSKAATLMLKAEVYLWSSRQMGGGTKDAQTASLALDDLRSHIPEPDLGLLENFSDVFSSDNKGNKELIFSVHHDQQEEQLCAGNWRNNMVPQHTTLSLYREKDGSKIDLDFDGNMYYPLNTGIYSRFDDSDTRKEATLKAVYTEFGAYEGCFAYKFTGITPDGASERLFENDFPVYRYADWLLMKAEAKSLTGENPAQEINAIRKRAYAANYNETRIGYPHKEGDADGIDEVLLRERLFEFAFEGKRWYDLRRFGNSYVLKYTSLANENHLLWPLDSDTMTDNPALEQTEGY